MTVTAWGVSCPGSVSRASLRSSPKQWISPRFTCRPLPSCILIDEAQFLTEAQVIQLHQLACTGGTPVICYGLRSDFRGQPFPGSRALLTLSDDLEEMKTICRCGRKATMNVRLDADGNRVTEGEQVEIGGNDRYEAVCPKRFYTGAC